MLATLSWACEPDALTSPDATSAQAAKGGGKPGGGGGATPAITLLPGLSKNASTATDVNDAGVVVGWSRDARGNMRAVYWTRASGSWVVTQLPDGGSGEAVAINPAGWVAGRASGGAVVWVPGAGGYQAHALGAGQVEGITSDGSLVGDVGEGPVVWRRAASGWQTEPLPAPAGGSVYSLSDNGVAVGRSPAGFGERAVYWTFAGGAWNGPTQLRDADQLSSSARRVNGAGAVAGVGFLCDGGHYGCISALLWRSLGGPREVVLQGDANWNAEVNDINEDGVLVGRRSNLLGGSSRGFWATSAADVRFLEPAKGHQGSIALALNRNKQVVGVSRGSVDRAALWTLP